MHQVERPPRKYGEKEADKAEVLGRNPPLYATTANAAKSAHPAATSLLVPAAAPL